MSLGPYKGAPGQVRRAVTHPFSSPFLSDRGCHPKLGKLHRSLQAAAYNPVYYNKPKYPELRMITVQGDFLAVFHLPSKCHMFPGVGRASSWGKHCQLRVKALWFHSIELSGSYSTEAATKRLQFIGTTDRIDEIAAPSYLFGRSM